MFTNEPLPGVKTMREIGAFEAKNKLGTLLNWVEHGEEVVITRRGKAVAKLVPAGSAANTASAQAAAIRIRERALALKARFDWKEWKSYKNEGRL
jgi:prevent-host-death family protein